jgi:hypothetical protein
MTGLDTPHILKVPFLEEFKENNRYNTNRNPIGFTSFVKSAFSSGSFSTDISE